MSIRTPSPLAVLVVSLALLIPVNFVAAAVRDDTPTSTVDNLLDPPRDGSIWFVGNSIFKTGVDFGRVSAELGHVPVDFEYHGGHYTSLWYLMAAHAMPDLEARPGVVVWGFRPHFAALPAFRQNAVNDTEKFMVDSDPVYDRLALTVEGPGNPLARAGADVESAAEKAALVEAREAAADTLAEAALRAGVAVGDLLDTSGARLVRDEVIDGEATFLDVLNAQVTGGEVQLAEERVVDGVGDFIIGERAEFADTFVPIIADRIAALDLPQLVVIWPPRLVAEGTPDPAEDAFVDDALAHFAAAGVPVLDLYHDDRIVLDHYASGDHFNADGRDLVTTILIERLREMGLAAD